MRWAWRIAYRDLTRNRRRTVFTLLAVALGLALLIVLNGYIAGILEDSLQNSIRLQTRHVQVRADSYEADRRSLQWKDLVNQPAAVVAQAQAMAAVWAAAPVLWSGALLSTREESVNLQLHGIEVASPIYDPIRSAVVEGTFLTAEDRGGLLLGRRLAESLGVHVGDSVRLTLVDANGVPVEALFVVRGLFASGVLVYDEATVFLPLAKAQSLTTVGDRASAVLIQLHRQEDADSVSAALAGPRLQTLTWRELNAFFLQSMGAALRFYLLFDGIVMLIVAVIIANTLLMAVFERTREIGILASLGMKRGQILCMLLLEATLLALIGSALGVLLGLAGVAVLTQNGFVMGEMAAAAGNLPLSNVVYARFVPDTFAWLTVWTLIVAVVASLYPAWFAARLEPVKALHAS
jgi:ABC-type lipoprotein release transport system permease subunit